MRDFRKYEVWESALGFVTKIYEITKSFPQSEMYGLSNQMHRAAVSVASNIAEGASRSSEIEFSRFLEISLGSAFEIETQLIISKNLSYIGCESFDELMSQLHPIQKKLNNLNSKIKLQGKGR